MIQSKKIGIITTIAVCLALVVTIALIGFSGSGAYNLYTEPEYANKIFGTDIISVEILADESDWQQMIDNAMSEEFIMVDVVVNGIKFQNVGIRPKGNSSLTHVAQNSESDRYSFRLQFDEYIKDQTCFGLKSFVVNNMLGDNTYMKEYVSYELMEEIGVDAPYFGYANISVNGNAVGLYLAVEMYNESYETRTFGTTSGMLYNVKSMEMGNNPGAGGGDNIPNERGQPDFGGGERPNRNQGNNIENNNPPAHGQTIQPNQTQAQSATSPTLVNGDAPLEPNNSSSEQAPQDEDINTDNRPTGALGGGMGKRGSNGGSLEYSDDSSSNYSAIFNNVVGKGSESDYQKVIKSLGALSEGKELEKYFDVDQILRYFAAHTIVVNLDSYSSSMAQNYYIYEKDGQITILPWDYNLAWGGFQRGSASSAINFPIDTPVSGVEMSARPLLEKLFENTQYLDKYHSYLQELMTNYFANGKWETKITELNTLISEYVKNDKTAFYTYEEYQKAVSAFVALGNLRAQSVQGQLDGTVPSTTAEQAANADKLISVGDLNLSDLGSMSGGKGEQNGGGQGGNSNKSMASMPNREVMDQVILVLQGAGGRTTDDVRTKLLELGLTEEQIEMVSNMPTGGQNGINAGGSIFGSTRRDNQNISQDENGEPPITNAMTKQIDYEYLLTIGILTFALLLAIVFISKQKRRY